MIVGAVTASVPTALQAAILSFRVSVEKIEEWSSLELAEIIIKNRVRINIKRGPVPCSVLWLPEYIFQK